MKVTIYTVLYKNLTFSVAGPFVAPSVPAHTYQGPQSIRHLQPLCTGWLAEFRNLLFCLIG